MKKLSTCLWFDTNGEEAMNFYLSVFKNSKKLGVSYYGKGMPMPEGSVLTADFEINGHQFLALNAGPIYKFTPAISFIINCDTQDEIDYYWDKLAEDGSYMECGWLTDKFGVTWQVVPVILEKLLTSDGNKAQKVLEALMKMKKLDIDKLQEAYENA
jgi:predicted 3-demethylubiquinone-9 3-methyltransferase (glyoxalase superfamily)